MRQKLSTQTLALSGVLTAAALVLLVIAGLIPSGWMGITAVAGLAVAVGVSACGYLSGCLIFAASGLLALLLLPAKQVAILYLCLFGCYPILKCLTEGLKYIALEYICKLAFFNLVFVALYRVIFAVLADSITVAASLPIPAWLVLVVVANAVFLLYDYAFSKVMAMLQARLIPQIRRLFRGR